MLPEVEAYTGSSSRNMPAPRRRGATFCLDAAAFHSQATHLSDGWYMNH